MKERIIHPDTAVKAVQAGLSEALTRKITQCQLNQWLRGKKIHIEMSTYIKDDVVKYSVQMYALGEYYELEDILIGDYEDVLEAALLASVELLIYVDSIYHDD